MKKVKWYVHVIVALLVLNMCYVGYYALTHKHEFMYYESDVSLHQIINYNASIPIGEENMLVKTTNPYVYYQTKYGGWLVLFAALLWLGKKTRERFVLRLKNTLKRFKQKE
jgi:hypothetical protein